MLCLRNINEKILFFYLIFFFAVWIRLNSFYIYSVSEKVNKFVIKTMVDFLFSKGVSV